MSRLVGAAQGNRNKSFIRYADADEGNQEGSKTVVRSHHITSLSRSSFHCTSRAGTENPGGVRVFAGGGELGVGLGALCRREAKVWRFVGWDARREVVPRAGKV